MADVKISGLPASTTPLAGTEVLPIVQGGVTKQVSVNNLTAGKSVSLTGITITGTGSRITGDFTSALSSRLLTQTSTADSSTNFGIIPSGTSTSSLFAAFNNSTPTNSSVAQLWSANSEVSLRSAIAGTGTYLPLTMYTGGAEALRIDTNRNVLIGTTTSPASGNGSLAIGGYGLVTYLVGNGATSSPNTPLLIQNPSANFTGAAGVTFLGAVIAPLVSNDGTGGSSTVTNRALLVSPAYTASGATATLNLQGITANVLRSYSTDTSNNANIFGISIATGHSSTLSTSAVSASVVGVNVNNSITVGSATSAIGVNLVVNAQPTSGSYTITNMAGFSLQQSLIGGAGGTIAVTNYYGLDLVAPTVGAGGSITGNYRPIFQRDTAGQNYLNAPTRLSNGYTVATLPAGVAGLRAYVTDANAPVFLNAVAGGGAVVCPVFHNGAAWVVG